MPVASASKDRRHGDHSKIRELILYVCEKCEPFRYFGKTKLIKVLFFSDFSAYAATGKSITEEIYSCFPYGPVPKDFYSIKDSMVMDNELAFRKNPIFNRTEDRPVAIRAADLSVFGAQEIALVDNVIEELRDMTGKEASELSHRFEGWKIVPEGHDIPYETVFLRDPKKLVVTEKRRSRAAELSDKYGLQQ